MSKKTNIIAMSADVSFAAAASEGTIGPRKFEVLAYTGGELMLPNFDLPVVVDLATLRTRNSLLANLDHKPNQRVGNVTVTNDGKTLVMAGTASAATPHRDEVIQSADAGFNWQASIEANGAKRPARLDTVRAGSTASVNGQTFKGPVYIARNWILGGMGFVSQGADDNTTVSIAATAASNQGDDMDPKFKTWLEARNWEADSLNAEQLETLQAAYDADNGKKPKKKEYDPDNLSEVLAAKNAERERRKQINEIAAKFCDRVPQHMIAAIEARAEQAIEADTSPQKFELDLWHDNNDFLPKIQVRASGGNRISGEVLEAALCQTGGLKDVEKRFSDQTLQAAHDQFKHGIGLRELMIICARENGYRSDSLNVTLDTQRAAFGQTANGRGEIHASGFSTMSIPGILSNTANKFLLEGWYGQDMTSMKVTATKPVKDFKTVTSYRLSGYMKYAKVGAGGELEHGRVSEDTYTNRADTYGKIFAITRTDYINDDLGALTSGPRELGLGAGDSFNEVFWTAFLDNSSFFASGNSNVSTGAGSALSLAGLTAAELVFLNQTKPNGQPLNILPDVLLVPAALKRTALALMNSTTIVATTTANAGLPDQNTFAGDYQVLSSPFMGNSAFTGYSTAAWYLLSTRLPVIETCFLNGQQTPTIETAQADFGVLGFQMRAYHDFGVSKQEPRGGVRSAGS